MTSKKIIKSLDKLSKIRRSGLTKLPVIPNTKGTYVAQYCIDKGTYGNNVIVYRVYPNTNSIAIYYLSPEQKNCRNLNSSNHRITIKSTEQLMLLIFFHFGRVNDNTHKAEVFIDNVDKLFHQKKNPFHVLEEIIKQITGRQYKVNTEKGSRHYMYRPDYIKPEDALKAAQTLKSFIEYSTQHGGCLDQKC